MNSVSPGGQVIGAGNNFRIKYGEFEKVMGLYINQIDEQKKSQGAKDEGNTDQIWKGITA